MWEPLRVVESGKQELLCLPALAQGCWTLQEFTAANDLGCPASWLPD